MDEKLYSRIKQLITVFDDMAGPGKALCLAVTAPDLALLCALRQPGAPLHIERMACGKAYTCARMGCSTDALHKRLIREQRTLADFMDPHMTAMQGGVPLRDESGTLIAGIGISGRLPEEDEIVALKVRDFLAG
ncbi:MAG: heme-binding protein [Mailhella sp.]|nr:heme-binding protein [Mailhella sp.]